MYGCDFNLSITIIGNCKPTLDQLVNENEGINSQSVVDIISACGHCDNFAALLLKSDIAAVKSSKGAADGDRNFIQTIFEIWLNRSDDDTTVAPRTWSALADCIERTCPPDCMDSAHDHDLSRRLADFIQITHVQQGVYSNI